MGVAGFVAKFSDFKRTKASRVRASRIMRGDKTARLKFRSLRACLVRA